MRSWRRVLLKVSGEAFSSAEGAPIDGSAVGDLADEIADAHALGVQIAIVNGGGNVLRGSQVEIPGLGRATADAMGMLATVVNALALQGVLESRGIDTRVLTAVEMRAVAEPYIRRRAVRHLQKDRVVILAGGTGHPFFSTDTTAALRGAEIAADVILKGTQVDGIYDRDPRRYPDARRYDRLTFDEAYVQRLEVMDRTAFSLCEENGLPIVVFAMAERGNLARILKGESIGTLVAAEDPDE